MTSCLKQMKRLRHKKSKRKNTRGHVDYHKYVDYLRCFSQLAEWFVMKCGSGFERVKGFGYARRLSVDVGMGRVELYLPLTRLLDFVI